MKLLAFDFETAGGETLVQGGKGKPKIRLDARKATPKLLSYATESTSGLLQPDEYKRLLPVLANPEVVKIGHNLAYDLGLIRAAVGHRFPVVNLFDTMIAYQLLIAGLYENSLKHSSLKAVVRELLGQELDKELQTSDWSGVHTAEQLSYALKDSEILIQLYPILQKMLEAAGLLRVAQIEFDCLPMTVEAMQTGLPLDVPGVQSKIGSLTQAIDDLEQQIRTIAKDAGWKSPSADKKRQELNLASSQHLKVLLQVVYGDEVQDSSEATIKALLVQQSDKPLAGMLREMKKWDMQRRFLRAWLKNHDGGRIYSSYQQIGTRTGRYTSSGPNAQQISKELRYLFKAAPGWTLVECDYSNIEMRLAAEISGEPTLLRLYHEGADLHRVTASKVFGISEDEVTKEQRQTAKIINFGALYGGGPRYLMNEIPGLTEDEAEKYLEAFKMGYPGLLTYWDRCKNKSLRMVVNGKEYHVARSALGRLEYVPRRDEATGRLHKKLKNRLVNVPIQASGVDLFKLASGLLYREFCKPEYADFNFLLSLHDSVLLECPAERAEECSELVNRVFMAAASEIFQDTPCKADIKIGTNWSFQKAEAA
ncbi:MAG TPA: DNA polymerase [Methanothrix soehngenii]|nr:DNA polymerase [Methanothrix soehngenii]